ncbi:MAG: hypothetical protein KDA53_15900 [Hyphomonas sp.]|nr:hypothetical protein [Hyphomonas sp.]
MSEAPSLPERLITLVLQAKPLIFAFGFLAPLIAQSLRALNVPLPEGLSPMIVGLVVAGIWGGIAQWTGRWI